MIIDKDMLYKYVDYNQQFIMLGMISNQLGLYIIRFKCIW